MDFSLFVLMLVSYCGIVAGFILGKIAPEERKPLRKAVISLQHVSIFVAFATSGVDAYVRANTRLMLSLLGLVLIIIYLHAKATGFLKDYKVALTSAALGMFVVFSSAHVALVTASLSFVFFACLGILETTSKLSSLVALALRTFWFLLVALLTLL
jgi:hypothetical protein